MHGRISPPTEKPGAIGAVADLLVTVAAVPIILFGWLLWKLGVRPRFRERPKFDGGQTRNGTVIEFEKPLGVYAALLRIDEAEQTDIAAE